MNTDVSDQIDQLSAERSILYRETANGRHGDRQAIARIQDISRTLEALWAQRRQQRAGRLDGIELVVDRAYARVYGERYDHSEGPLSESARTAKSLAA